MLTALGLMSGTSADGVSAALCRVGDREVRLLAHRDFPYAPAVRGRILRAARGGARTEELSKLNAELGHLFARAAVKVLGRRRVDVIGSHGQTVWHEPARHTLQLGEAAAIAEATGVTTVCDFRPADIAAGGQGAPLVPYFDWYVFGGMPLALLNIGGMANVTVVGRTPRETRGFDTGPGNVLIDEAMRIAFGRDFDEDGRVAAGGKIDPALLARLDHPFFRKKPPKSTGRELFNGEYLLERCGKELRRRPADVVATLTFFTADTVAVALAGFAGPRILQVVVSGGGALNPVLMNHLRWRIPSMVTSIEAYGFPPLSKEPAAFALLAAEAVRGAAAGMPSATGARCAAVLGKIVPGGNFRRLMRRLHGPTR